MLKSVVGVALGLLMGVGGANAQTGLPQGTIFYQFYNRNNNWIDSVPGRGFNAQITRTQVPGGPQLVGVDCYGITFDPKTRQMCFARTRTVSKGKFTGGPLVFYLSNLDGTGARLLERERVDYSGASELVSDYTPYYTSNGDLLFETGNRIARMNGDGSNVRFLTGASENCGSPSEGGGLISFEKNGVCVCDANGYNRRRLASFPTYYGQTESGEGPYTDSKLSPDGKQIAFVRDDQIFVMSTLTPGAKSRRVSDASTLLEYSDPVWSPDGRFLAVGVAGQGGSAAQRSDSPRGDSHDIYLINISTGKMTQLTSSPDDELPGDWRLVP